jgi:hypothetical protein
MSKEGSSMIQAPDKRGPRNHERRVSYVSQYSVFFF